ncbi:MAG: hypothetical protein HY728_03705 [Candidatus Rokubacteria bacterium]|nr:hypothetical protein [Candidatus Rokubacteria bacterium]
MRGFRLGLLLIALVVGGCVTSPTRPVRSEFEDTPMPKGLTLLEDHSTVIESPSVKAARLLYRGRIEVSSLATATRTTLEANGWRHVSSATAGDQGTTQVYEKAGNSLQVRFWEGWYYTYVELTASRALQPPK